MRNIHERRIIRDVTIVVLSIVVATIFARSPLIDTLFSIISLHYVVAAFVAGLFFTSSFTTAPAIVILARLSIAFSPLDIGLIAALGALIGDYILFSFIKSHLAEDIAYVLSRSKARKIIHALKLHSVRWLMTVVGALIIASPFPDEFGLALIGMSRITTWKFCILSFAFNFLGVLVIAFVARGAVGM